MPHLRVEPVDPPLNLRRHGPLLELQLPGVHHGPGGGWEGVSGSPMTPPVFLVPPPSSPQHGEAPGADVLAAVLDPRNQIGDEFVDGALVLNGARHPLCHLHLVTLAGGGGRDRGQGWGSETPLDPPHPTVMYLK